VRFSFSRFKIREHPRKSVGDFEVSGQLLKSSAVPPTSTKLDAVPLLDLQRQYTHIREDVLAAIERVCASQHFILGAEVEALEREVAAFTESADAVGCASGTDALWLALAAAGVQSGDAVITTAFSFFASASAIVRTGARPVFADIDPRTLNLDPASVEAHLRSSSYKVKAILPVHLYGQCANMDELDRFAKEYKVLVVEDAAQAIGAAWHDRKAGSLGITAAFSFYPTKNLSAYGDAGLVTTCDLELAEHMRRLRNHGSPQRYLHEEFGWNARMDAIQAAVLRVKLPHIEKWNRARREHAVRYTMLLAEAGLLSLAGHSPIRLLEITPGAHHVFHQYVIRAERRDELRRFLTNLKIGTEVYYPIPLHLQPVFAYLGYREGDLPESERAARDVLALPMFPELTEEEQRWVVASIAEFYS
jgi:dTDP-4-amino-4,6-dideoxygalactose transaminase